MSASLDDGRIVITLERIEALRMGLGGAVATHEFALEKDAHLAHEGLTVGLTCGGYLDGGKEVFLAIGAYLANGELRACEDDGLREVFEHKAQCRGGVRHGVCAVEDHKAIIVSIVVANDVCQLHPAFGGDVGRVDGWRERIVVEVVAKLDDLWHVVHELVEVEVFEGSRAWVFVHAYRTPCVDDEDRGCV